MAVRVDETDLRHYSGAVLTSRWQSAIHSHSYNVCPTQQLQIYHQSTAHFHQELCDDGFAASLSIRGEMSAHSILDACLQIMW